MHERMQYSVKLSAISDAGGEDAAYIDPGGVLAAGTDTFAPYSNELRLCVTRKCCQRF